MQKYKKYNLAIFTNKHESLNWEGAYSTWMYIYTIYLECPHHRLKPFLQGAEAARHKVTWKASVGGEGGKADRV